MLSVNEDPTVLYVLDAGIDDASAILSAVSTGPAVRLVQLAADRDPVAQITEAIRGSRDVAAVHIVSHGFGGGLSLGSTRFDADSLGRSAAEISGWREHLTPGADILLYGCDVAAGDAGAAFLASLASLSGADVAASTDPTGAASLGGDWTLEAATGPIEAQTIAASGFSSLLTAGTTTTNPTLPTFDGSDGNDTFLIEAAKVTKQGGTAQPVSTAQQATISGKKGNDTFKVSGFPGSAGTIKIDGNEGDDTVSFTDTTVSGIKLTGVSSAQILKKAAPGDTVLGTISNVEVVKFAAAATLDLSALSDELLVRAVGNDKVEVLRSKIGRAHV